MAVRQTLPTLEMIAWEGLYTKQNPETLQVTQLRECQNADFFREYGSLSKLRGTKRVLSSQYTEGGTAKPVAWGTFYKALELSGQIIRRNLIAAGTTIRLLNDDGTTTQLLSGEPSGLFRTDAQLDRFLFITSQNPTSVGDRGQMSKYDGTSITPWGLTAPGGQDTAVETFNDSSIFTTSNCTVADSTLPAYKGTATAMTKGTASTSCYIEDLNRSPFAINTVIEDRAQLNLYVSRSDFSKLATSGRCVSIYIGSGSDLSTNYYRYDFQIGRLVPGWNSLIMDFSTFPSGDFGTTAGTPDDTALASIRFEVITNNATDAPVIYWDNFVKFDQGGAEPTFSGAGGSVFNQASDAVWSLKVTFIDQNGNESNAGPASVDADNTTGSTDYGTITWASIPTSSNSSVVKRNLYRTVAGGADYLFLATINDNVTTSYTDTTADASLGTNTPPLIGDTIFDNSPPPSAGIVVIWNRTAFLAGDPLNPNLLYYSQYNLPEAWPIVNTIEFDDRITGMFKTYLGLVVTTETSYWRVIGDNPDYTVDQVINGFGGVGPRAVGTAREVGWIVDREGMRLYDLKETSKISEVIRDRIDAFNKVALEDAHTAHSKTNNAITWFTKDASGNYTDSYMYQYMIDEIRQGWFSQIVPNPTTLNFQHVWENEDANGDALLYAGTDKGMVFELFSPNSVNWVDETGQTRSVNMKLQTAFIRPAATADTRELEGVSGRAALRFIEFRAKENNGLAHEWTITVDTSDSASENATVRDTQDITFSFPAGVSLLRLAPRNLTSAEYLRITIQNTQKDKDLSIMGLKLYYHARPGAFQVAGTAGGQA